jgi:hypothetical protein
MRGPRYGRLVGGSIALPHLRRVWDLWNTMEREEADGADG